MHQQVKETINIPKGVDNGVNLRVSKKGNDRVVLSMEAGASAWREGHLNLADSTQPRLHNETYTPLLESRSTREHGAWST